MTGELVNKGQCGRTRISFGHVILELQSRIFGKSWTKLEILRPPFERNLGFIEETHG
jgi:hypothetical protein